MIACEQMLEHHINGNENNANEMINNLSNFANNMNDNDIIRGREIVQLLVSMNDTVNIVRNNCYNEMNLMKRQMEDQILHIMDEIRYLREEVIRLNNVIHAQPPPPHPVYTKEELCAELLESIEDTKEQMQDQTYRTLTDKLMEIYNR